MSPFRLHPNPSAAVQILSQCWRSGKDERSLISDAISLEAFGEGVVTAMMLVESAGDVVGVKLDLLFLSQHKGPTVGDSQEEKLQLIGRLQKSFSHTPVTLKDR